VVFAADEAVIAEPIEFFEKERVIQLFAVPLVAAECARLAASL
jgi:hypothetical protein